MRVGVARKTIASWCGKSAVIKDFADLINCNGPGTYLSLFFQHIHEPVELIFYNKAGTLKHLHQNGTAIQALRRNEIDSIFSTVQLPNINFPLEKQNALSQNLSYVFVHKVSIANAFTSRSIFHYEKAFTVVRLK